jgi:nucleotide-binding universal stress UspA family protein
VMSLDNVIGVAAAAKGDDVLVFLGLAISIPLIIFGSTVIVKLMDRFPIIITAGAALLGWVAGEMLITDPSIVSWIATHWSWMEMHWPLVGEVSWAQIGGALFVLAVGKIMTARAATGEIVAQGEVEVPGDDREVGRKVLLLVDGSDCALRAAQYIARANDSYKKAPEMHLLNVQRPFPGTVGGHAGAEKLHEEEGLKALAAARKVLDKAKVSYSHHVGVGDPVDVVANFVRDEGIYSIVMGCHGAGAAANLLLGSFASKVLSEVNVPVVLIK